jgi:hypothetical protein
MRAMRPTLALAAVLAILLLAGCKIILQPDDGGRIVSASGDSDCFKGSCVVEISGQYAEVFTALADPGYFFTGWEELCSNRPDEPCELNLPATWTTLDVEVRLIAHFERKQVPTLNWQIDETTPTPTRQLGSCVESVIGCLGAGTDLGECFGDIVPVCDAETSDGCCQQICVDQVNTQLEQGANDQLTVLAVFVNDGSCMPGNAPWGTP